MKVAAACLPALAVFLVAALGVAATSLKTTASARQVEVGQPVQIELSALSDDDDDPGDARLQAPPTFTVQGPSVSSSRQISFVNGSFASRHGLTATWRVAGAKPGRYAIGPATVRVGKTVVQGETIQLEVVAPGSLPQAPPRRRGMFDPMDPFDPFGMLQRMPNVDMDDSAFDTVREPPQEYQVEAAPDPLAFVRATVNPARVVVGEQVTLRIYAYGKAGLFEEVGSSEPSRPDFLSQVLVESSYRQTRYYTQIAGERWMVVKVREIALFPLRAGTLPIGPMTMGFRGRGYPEGPPPGGLRRESAPLTVLAVDPPVAGRPPGYELGDVGAYSLSTEVDPKRVEAGGAVSVVVRIDGTGNVPGHVKKPEVPGAEWLTPTVSDAVGATGSRVGGSRTLRYVVRLDEPGTRDLGEVSLPYYDPAKGRYEVARAAVGRVEVLPGATPPPLASAKAAAQAPATDPFAGLEGLRRSLGHASPPPARRTDKPAFWALAVGSPFAVVFARLLVTALAAVRRRAAARSSSLGAQIRKSLADARAAAEQKNPAAVAAAVERAVYTAIEDRLGFRARAVLRDRLAGELVKAGADPALSKDTVAALDACDGLRFAGGASPGDGVAAAESVIARIGRLPKIAREASP